MVNTGRPSRGCFACRKRRVKCDEAKPHCQRCTNLKRECPGYQDTWSAVVRSQNDWAKTNVSRRVEYKLKEREFNDLQRHAQDFLTNNDKWAVGYPAPSLPPHFHIIPEVFAVNRFYTDYVLTSGTLPLLDNLPQIYADPKCDPCLREAVPAVALASMARQQNRYDLMHAAQYHYGQTLKRLAEVLHDETRAAHDAALITVFLLGLYEFITIDVLPEREWDSHGSGRVALLKLRGKKQLENQAGKSLFILLNHQLLISSFLSSKSPEGYFLEWIDSDLSVDVVFALESIIYTASRLCHDLQSASTGQTECTNDELIEMIRTCIALDRKVETWNVELPEKWPDAARIMELVRTQGEMGNAVMGLCNSHPQDGSLYSGITRAITRAQYRTVRIHLLQTISSAVTLVHDCPELEDPTLLEKWHKTIGTLAEEICDATPLILGETDETGKPVFPHVSGAALRGYALLWPLRVASTAAGISAKKKSWISKKLKYIGQSLGIGRATAIADAVENVIY